MNKPWVLQQLDQAHFELGQLIDRIRADEDDGFPELQVRLPFVYRHLNCAWNTRQASDEEIDEGFKTQRSQTADWRGFPHDLDSLIHD